MIYSVLLSHFKITCYFSGLLNMINHFSSFFTVFMDSFILNVFCFVVFTPHFFLNLWVSKSFLKLAPKTFDVTFLRVDSFWNDKMF